MPPCGVFSVRGGDARASKKRKEENEKKSTAAKMGTTVEDEVFACEVEQRLQDEDRSAYEPRMRGTQEKDVRV